MNILRHKSWHVRTQKNMDRVKRDEMKAAEEEKQILDRQIQAENERRINSLRMRADEKMTTMFGVPSSSSKELNSRKDMSISDETGHVNLFQDLEREERKNLGTGNKEYEADKAAEKREYESKMGIQVYFADNTNDLDKKKEWYEKLPSRGRKFEKPTEKEDFLAARAKLDREMEEKKRLDRKRKQSDSEDSEDSENDRKKRKKAKKEKKKSKKKDKDKKKKKKHHRSRDSSEEREIDMKYEVEKKRRLAEMRDERIKRERVESARTHALLHPNEKKNEEKEKSMSKKPKYNSQFNPEFFSGESR